MALPVPIIQTDSSLPAYTKFMSNGMGFAFLASAWSVAIPPTPPQYIPTEDDWFKGDSFVVGRILYRIIQNDDDSIPPDDLMTILGDPNQRSDWHIYGGTENLRYIDRVYDVGVVDRANGEHSVMMPDIPEVDAATKCYWVTAWLGLATGDILAGYAAPVLILTVDIKANGLDGPIIVETSEQITLAWTSENAVSLTLDNTERAGGPNPRGLNGSQTIAFSSPGIEIYEVVATDIGGITATDSVQITVVDP